MIAFQRAKLKKMLSTTGFESQPSTPFNGNVSKKAVATTLSSVASQEHSYFLGFDPSTENTDDQQVFLDDPHQGV